MEPKEDQQDSEKVTSKKISIPMNDSFEYKPFQPIIYEDEDEEAVIELRNEPDIDDILPKRRKKGSKISPEKFENFSFLEHAKGWYSRLRDISTNINEEFMLKMENMKIVKDVEYQKLRRKVHSDLHNLLIDIQCFSDFLFNKWKQLKLSATKEVDIIASIIKRFEMHLYCDLQTSTFLMISECHSRNKKIIKWLNKSLKVLHVYDDLKQHYNDFVINKIEMPSEYVNSYVKYMNKTYGGGCESDVKDFFRECLEKCLVTNVENIRILNDLVMKDTIVNAYLDIIKKYKIKSVNEKIANIYIGLSTTTQKAEHKKKYLCKSYEFFAKVKCNSIVDIISYDVILNSLGKNYCLEKKFDKALEFYVREMLCLSRISWQKVTYKFFFDFACLFIHLGYFDKAVKMLERLQGIHEREVMMDVKEYREFTKFREAYNLKNHKNIRLNHSCVNCYDLRIYLSFSYHSLREYDKALYWLREIHDCLDLLKTTQSVSQDRIIQLIALNDLLGNYYYKQKKHNKAKIKWKKCVNLCYEFHVKDTGTIFNINQIMEKAARPNRYMKKNKKKKEKVKHIIDYKKMDLIKLQEEFMLETVEEMLTKVNFVFNNALYLLENFVTNRNCGYCRRKICFLRACSGCKSIVYCSKLCQKSDWNDHKVECKKIKTQKVKKK